MEENERQKTEKRLRWINKCNEKNYEYKDYEEIIRIKWEVKYLKGRKWEKEKTERAKEMK